MDHQKTGSLIAARRTELGLTQKELAKQLNISDRTVSKWERGAGFPDISLLEPLADALGVTLLELFHGERTPEPELKQETEDAARETVRHLKPQFKKTAQHLRRFRRLLVAALIVFVFLLLHPDRSYVYFTENLTPAQAVQTCPFILITTQEFDLIHQICADPDIAPHLMEGHAFELSGALTDRYRDLAQINGQPADQFTISILGESFMIDCWAGNARYLLSVVPSENLVRKTVAEYRFSYSDEFFPRNPRYCLENENNSLFSKLNSRRDFLAPLRFS